MNFFKKEIKTSTGLIAIFGAAVMLFGGAFTYYYRMAPTTYDYEVHNYTVAKKASVDSGTTKDWKTYENASYGLSFKYPKEWPTPKETVTKKSDDSMLNMNYTFLDFNNGDSSKDVRYYADITRFDDYSLNYADSLQKLKDVYTNSKVVGTEKLWLPPSNAMIAANSKTEFIQTADKKYRGLVYFANIGQDISTDLDCLVIMTDGTDSIIQFHITGVSVKSNYFTQKGLDKESTRNEFATYVAGLTTKNTEETTIKDFVSTYSLLAKSLKSVTKTAVTASSTVASSTSTTATNLTYANTDYGFGLTLPASWDEYKVKKTVVEGEVATYYFELPTTDPLYAQATTTADAGYAAPFVIGVMNKADWTGDELQVRDYGDKVGENASYVFTYSRWQASPQDLTVSSQDLQTIIASFKLN